MRAKRAPGIPVAPLLLLSAFCSSCSCGVVAEFQPNVPEGGRAIAIATRPGFDGEMIVASESGGLFRTVNGGERWTHVDAVTNYLMSDIEFNPSDPEVVVATAFADFAASNGGGVWRSSDGGSTWSHQPASLPPEGPRCPDFPSANGLSFQPDSGLLVVGTTCGLAHSADLGATWIHRPLDPSVPTDQWKTQNAVWSVQAVGGGRVFAAAADGVWYSHDEGVSWSRSTNGPSRGIPGVPHAFAASPFSDDHVFLTAGNRELFLTTDGGVTWSALPTVVDPSATRGPFVRTARVVSESSVPRFHIYFGNGVHLHRQEFAHSPSGPVTSGPWTKLQLGHPDPTDIAFDETGSVPVLLTTDGGVHETSDGGVTWQLSGTDAGYNALQITEVTGSQVTGLTPHLDLYYATQDNYLAASSDGGRTWTVHRGQPFCCEGFFLDAPREGHIQNPVRINGVSVSGRTTNFIAAPHLSEGREWLNAPDDDSKLNRRGEPDQDGNPYLVRSGAYVQRAVNDDVTPTVERYKRTENTGITWTDAYILPHPSAGRGSVVGPESDPIIYHPVARPGRSTNGLFRVGLVRVSNVLGPGPGVVDLADGAGFGNLGVFPTMFAHYNVYAANPTFPNHLIVADSEDDVMKRSYDHGRSWEVDRVLTQAVTNNGAFRFRKAKPLNRRSRAYTLATAIAFDPYNPCHVLVGTAQNGVIRSIDGGRAWRKVAGSESASNVSSFYFPPAGAVIFSTYGRGLWKLDVERSGTCRPIMTASFPAREPIIVYRTGDSRPYRGVGRIPGCLVCQLILVRGGRFTDVALAGETLERVWISGGSVHQLDADGREVPLSVPNEYRAVVGSFSDDALLGSLRGEDATIRGLLLDGVQLVGAITAADELSFTPDRAPGVRASGNGILGGVTLVRPGDTIGLAGWDFVSDPARSATVHVWLDGSLELSVPTDDSGGFSIELAVPEWIPGDYDIVIEQRTGFQLTRIETPVRVVVSDSPNDTS